MLQEVKATKQGKCARCGRDIKPNWSVYFNSETKQVFCKLCVSSFSGASMSLPNNYPDSIKDTLDEVISTVKANNELLGSFGIRLNAILELLSQSPKTTSKTAKKS